MNRKELEIFNGLKNQILFTVEAIRELEDGEGCWFSCFLAYNPHNWACLRQAQDADFPICVFCYNLSRGQLEL